MFLDEAVLAVVPSSMAGCCLPRLAAAPSTLVDSAMLRGRQWRLARHSCFGDDVEPLSIEAAA